MRIDYPHGDGWIELPDEWLGAHARRRDEAIEKSKALPATWLEFAVAMSLLDDWQLPGLPKNTDLWDFNVMSLRMMAWVKITVLESFAACFKIPKNSLPPLPTVSAAAANSEAGGDLTATE